MVDEVSEDFELNVVAEADLGASPAEAMEVDEGEAEGDEGAEGIGEVKEEGDVEDSGNDSSCDVGGRRTDGRERRCVEL